MSKFAIAFVTPTKHNELRHRIIESADQDTALRKFFAEESASFYSNDEQGYFYFKEDFYDKTTKSGSVLKCE